METRMRFARQSGALYLVVVLTGILSLAYVPSQLIDWKDAAKTFSQIQNSEMLFRLGIVAGVICYTAFLLLPLSLYRLLAPVHQTAAQLMVALSVVSVPFSLFNLLYKVQVLSLIQSGKTQTENLPHLQEEVLQLLGNYNLGIELVSVFWGLWLLPFGYLVYRSSFLPKILGLLLMAGCFGYLVNYLGGFLFPVEYGHLGISGIVSLPASLGEIGTCLWLLIFGARKGFSFSKNR